MTERKTLNRYYPVDYDPAKIPKLKGKQKEANRLWGIRVMAPFNMRCNTCGEYIYKGKKFNSKKETVEDEDYLGIQIHRFYIRCPRCVAVIAFKTDPEHCDYTCEAGATRNFEAAKTLMDMEKKKQKEIEDEEAANPMKVLENRTKASRNEMDAIEALTELRELNARHEKVDHEGMIRKTALFQKELERLQKEEEDRLIRDLFGGNTDSAESSNAGEIIRRVEDSSDDEDTLPPQSKIPKVSNPTEFLTQGDNSRSEKTESNSYSHKKPKSTKALLSGLIKVKKPTNSTEKPNVSSSERVNSVPEQTDSAGVSAELKTEDSLGSTDIKVNGQNRTTEINGQATGTGNKPAGALSMLGGYASSSASDSD